MHNTQTRTKAQCGLKIGDVVIIRDDKVKSRNSWRLGRVESLVIGQDGHVRGANLLTRSEEGRRTTMSRPIQKLIPLEVLPDGSRSEPISAKPVVHASNETSLEMRNNANDIDTPSDATARSPRKRRACALTGELRRRLQNQNP